MSALSNYLEDALLNLTLRNTALSPPASVTVGLYTADPTDAGSGTEVTGGSYARVTVSTSGGFNAPSGGAVTNAADITFPTATAGWGTVTHVAIWASANLLYHGPLAASKVVASGDTFRFPAGQLSVALD